MNHSLILGGTSGLGFEIAKQSLIRGITPVVTGHSVKRSEPFTGFGKGIYLNFLDLPNVAHDLGLAYKAAPHFDHVFWVAGVFKRQPFSEMKPEDIDAMTKVHLLGPLRALQTIMVAQKKPFHLTVIASNSSWRLREDESIYCMTKSAQATFTRQFAVELLRDRPGSKVTLVNPGGMATAFWNKTGQDTSDYMSPGAVAMLVWNNLQSQIGNFRELQILRREDGMLSVEPGPRLPEIL